MNALRKLAAGAPVPLFVAEGEGGRERIEDLALSADIDWVASPRHASIVLVVGRIRAADREALQRVHDQLPHPRATLCWGSDADLPGALRVDATADPQETLRSLYRDLLFGTRASDPHWLPDEPPAPWRGLGDHGQGGKGMMGGTPYGRPMPMPPQADIRDGLNLDPYTARFGPFLPLLPPGLVLELTLQGDVVQSATVIRSPYEPGAALFEPFRRALTEPVTIATLERLRAGHHLRCVAQVLTLLQLPSRAERCRRMVHAVEAGKGADIAGLHRTLRRSGALRAIPTGLGRITADEAVALGGVVQRAAGELADARLDQSPYQVLGFEPVVQGAGTARARVDQWLAEAAQSLALIRAAGDATIQATALEGPCGRVSRDEAAPAAAPDLAQRLPGLEWGQALLLLASFDRAALVRMLPVAQANDDSDAADEADSK